MFLVGEISEVPEISEHYLEFSDIHSNVSDNFNRVLRPDLYRLWTIYHMSENNIVAKFVRGCHALAQVVHNYDPSDTTSILNRLHEYCSETDIMQEIFDAKKEA